MSWLSDLTGIHISPKKAYINRDQLGRALKVVAPIAGAFTGGLGGLALGGLGSALGTGVQRGTNFGDILKGGLVGAGSSALGAKLMGKESGIGALGRAFGIGTKAAPAGQVLQQGGEVASAAGDTVFGASKAADVAGGAAKEAVKQAAKKGWMGQLGGFVKDNPALIGGAAMAASSYGKNKAEGRLAEAEARRLSEEDELRKKRDKLLEPMRRQLAAQFGGGRGYGGAVNPYA